MNKEQILLDELNKVGNFTTVTQEFSSDQLGVIYGCMDAVNSLNLADIRLSCFKEVFEKFQEIQEESEFYGWLHSNAHKS